MFASEHFLKEEKMEKIDDVLLSEEEVEEVRSRFGRRSLESIAEEFGVVVIDKKVTEENVWVLKVRGEEKQIGQMKAFF
ncbi:MAG: hypothetical protein ABH830_04700 [Patescibacteria group bacterium]